MTIKTFDVVNGRHLVPDVNTLDAAATLARKREVEKLLAATRDNPARAAGRERLKADNDALSRRLTELKEETKRENTRRNFAGIGSPLHEAIVARLDATLVVELEHDALARLAERERHSAERKAKKAGG